MSNKTVSKGMIMKQPAIGWQDALPCGNGILGALVYGHIRDEKIVLNHDNLWIRHDKPALRPVNQFLDELREMLLQGRYQKGRDFFEDKLKENYSGIQRPAPYQPAFDIHDSEGAAAMGSGKDIGGVQLPFTYEITAENEFICKIKRFGTLNATLCNR